MMAYISGIENVFRRKNTNSIVGAVPSAPSSMSTIFYLFGGHTNIFEL